jgi:prevent-host-death family protein
VVTVIPQRELRNSISDILRRAEAGESFTVTVGGRPVAELGPLSRPKRLADPARLTELLADSPVDAEWRDELADLRRADRETATEPWR